MALWIHSLSSTEAGQECQQGEGLLFLRQDANKLRSLQEPSGRRLASFVWPWASLPRTTKNKPAHRCTPIIDSKNSFLRTPKCYLQWSWARDPEDSKNDPMVRARKRRANREPSQVIGRPCQLVNVGLDSSNKAEAACLVKASSKLTSLAFLVGTAVLLRCSQFFGGNKREMEPWETTRKKKIVVLASTYTVGNLSSTDVLSNESKRMVLLFAWNAIGQQSLANFVVK